MHKTEHTANQLVLTCTPHFHGNSISYIPSLKLVLAPVQKRATFPHGHMCTKVPQRTLKSPQKLPVQIGMHIKELLHVGRRCLLRRKVAKNVASSCGHVATLTLHGAALACTRGCL